MFCLQCGTAVMPRVGADVSGPEVEDTTDPLLQKAIMDSFGHDMKFRLPVSGAQPTRATKAFVSMRSVLAPPQLAAAGTGTVGVPVRAVSGPAPTAKPDGGHADRVGGESPVGLMKSVLLRLRAVPRAWAAGALVFGLFLAANGIIYAEYANRVYPGVRVGQTDLSGVALSDLHGRLVALVGPSKLAVHVGSGFYNLTFPADAGRLNAVEMQVREAGHSTPMPLAGMLETLASKPLTMQPAMSDEVARQAAEQVAGRFDFAPTPAVAMVVAGKVLLISDKAGQSLDLGQTAAAIKSAYGKDNGINLQPKQLEPLVRESAYAAEVERAQTVLTQTVKVYVESAVYQPSAAEVGDWLVINGPGKGVTVDPASVAAYVAGLPGKFDRTGTVNALVAALNNGQSVDYTASTVRVTAAPKPVSTAAAWPLATYRYCLGDGVAASFVTKIGAVLSDPTGWALKGRVKLVGSESSCNFNFNIVPAIDMANLDPGCKGQTTCLVGDQITVRSESWTKVPVKWVGTLDSYRKELVNHEVGHWLGFQHAACTGGTIVSGDVPILAAPDVAVNGCSPNWYAIPVAQQGSKVLAGF
ncbi:MAG TPA: DUF3152 domain-containing protein [Candidatus Saccharimonadia bacterium]|jgi:hypothetical protein